MQIANNESARACAADNALCVLRTRLGASVACLCVPCGGSLLAQLLPNSERQ